MPWLKSSPLLEANIPSSSCTLLCLLTLRVLLPLNPRTPYRCCDRSELHLIVALGNYVLVNFILSNDWMKQIGDVLGYGANYLCVSLQDDIHNFRLTYRAPQNSVSSPYLRSSHEISFMALPKIEGLISVMTDFNPTSPWLGSARDMVRILQASAATGLPPITALSKLALSFLRKEYMDTTLDGQFMPPPNPAVLNSLAQGDVGASNPSHLRFERSVEENVETLVTCSRKG